MSSNKSRFAVVSAAALAVLASTVVSAAANPSGKSLAGPCPVSDGVVVTCGVRYADDGDPAHTLDIYRPAGVTGAPVVMVIHGGRWAQGTSLTRAKQAEYFAQNGLAAVSINYTLSRPGKPSWPKVFDDVEASAAWVRANGAAYGLDGTRMGAFGESAGGHLVSLLATDSAAQILAAVSLSGPMDLNASDGGLQEEFIVEQLLGCVPRDCAGVAADASPINAVDPTDGDMLIFNSAHETVPASQAVAMDAALTSASVPHEVVILPGSLHAMAYDCSTVTVAGKRQTVIAASFTYLASRLLTGAAPVPSGYCKP